MAKLSITPTLRILAAALGLLLTIVGLGSLREDTAGLIQMLGPLGVFFTTPEGATVLLIFGILVVVYACFGTTVRQDLERIATVHEGPYPVAITITEPIEGAPVNRRARVAGTVEPEDTPVQVLVFARDNRWHLQPTVTCQGSRWSVGAYFGNDATPDGVVYRIVAIAGGAIADKTLSQLPSGVSRTQERKVVLKSVDTPPAPSLTPLTAPPIAQAPAIEQQSHLPRLTAEARLVSKTFTRPTRELMGTGWVAQLRVQNQSTDGKAPPVRVVAHINYRVQFGKRLQLIGRWGDGPLPVHPDAAVPPIEIEPGQCRDLDVAIQWVGDGSWHALDNRAPSFDYRVPEYRLVSEPVRGTVVLQGTASARWSFELLPAPISGTPVFRLLDEMAAADEKHIAPGLSEEASRSRRTRSKPNRPFEGHDILAKFKEQLKQQEREQSAARIAMVPDRLETIRRLDEIVQTLHEADNLCLAVLANPTCALIGYREIEDRLDRQYGYNEGRLRAFSDDGAKLADVLFDALKYLRGAEGYFRRAEGRPGQEYETARERAQAFRRCREEFRRLEIGVRRSLAGNP